MPPQNGGRRMRSKAVQLSAVGVLSVSLVACSSSTSASCVDGQSSRGGSLRVVPDRYCDNGGSYGRYYWYYGGHYHGGYISRGTTIRPRGSRITSRGGRVISRGGFGGHSGSHGG
jgi:hypothetical protein